ncbi:Mitochondrial substrate/solute carrier [Phaffia rhodozyma]|uniref:Mitochondrial substrate/solute carrier n=1 Tax=Phaffia rhodozyma TaxID=264483 RepID=A0A0F7SQU8_PHARH|nr:Mitochondrial substrate/solute carrier [Phaffia rhodozyma]
MIGLIVVPIDGSIVRLRANYAPRGLALSEIETEAGDPRVGPAVRKVWGMISRVRRLEGWKGLYKGFLPFIFNSVLISVFSVAFVEGSSTVSPKGTYQVPEAGGVKMTLFGIALTLVGIPMTVLINRSIVTPHLLPWSPKKAAKIILTPYERSKPWIIFLTPGLLAATAIHVLYIVVVSKTVRSFVVPELANGIFKNPSSSRDGPFATIRTGRLFVFLIFQALSVLVLCPLEVIACRLSVQRQNAEGEQSTGEIPSTYAAKDEDVITLRGEEEPYNGLIDAAMTIYQEEGAGRLYTAWIVTLFGALFGALFA